MSDEHDDDGDDGDSEGVENGQDERVASVNGALLEMIAENVKLGIILLEMPYNELLGVRARLSAYIATVNAVDLEQLLKKKKKQINHS